MCNIFTLLLILILYLYTSLFRAHVQGTLSALLPLAADPIVTMPPITPYLDSTKYSRSMISSVPINPSLPGQPPLETLPELVIVAEQPHDGAGAKNRVFNYYFLFLALIAGVLAVLLWLLHRQRRHGQQRRRLRGQNTMARDAEQWALNRRNQLHNVEGLNETGEAPPPYKPKEEDIVTQHLLNRNPELATGVTVPPRALPRNESGYAQPPAYIETARLDEPMSAGSASSVPRLVPACAVDRAT